MPYELVLYHHGRKGQRWGIKNGPPYPLGSNITSGYIKKQQKRNAKAIKKGNYEELEKAISNLSTFKAYKDAIETTRKVDTYTNDREVREKYITKAAKIKLLEDLEQNDKDIVNLKKTLSERKLAGLDDYDKTYDALDAALMNRATLKARMKMVNDTGKIPDRVDIDTAEYFQNIDDLAETMHLKDNPQIKEAYHKRSDALASYADEVDSFIDDYLGKYGKQRTVITTPNGKYIVSVKEKARRRAHVLPTE